MSETSDQKSGGEEVKAQEWQVTSNKVSDDSDTCFQMIVCQSPLRSTERQGQHSCHQPMEQLSYSIHSS